MEIPRKAWQNYISKLSKINKKAAQIMTDWIDANGYDSIENMIAVANGLTQKYGEASAALACEMYDSIAAASGVAVPPAIPAEVMPEEYVAQAVRKTVDQAPTTVPNVVGRMVKQAGADTMLQNARRDGAQFAWIPSGDTCAFCITLASRGWQYMSKNALKNGHAEHIHSNCDCEYAIRFSEKDDVAGYDPQKYEEMYRNADGNTPQEKINAMRRAFAEKQSKSVEEVVEKIAFVPAKTIEEAEQYAERFVESYKTKYTGNINYKGVDIEHANQINKALTEVFDAYETDYPLKNILPFNKREKMFKDNTAEMAYQWGTCNFYFNKDYIKTGKAFLAHKKQAEDLLDVVLSNIDIAIEKNSTSTSFSARKQAQYLNALKETKRATVSMADTYGSAVHELGHYLDDRVFRKAMKDRAFDLSASFEKYSSKISAYATASTNEYVAESFASYWIGETGRIDPELEKIFKELQKK